MHPFLKKTLSASKAIILFICSLLSSCKTNQNALDPYRHIEDAKVVEILQKSFESSGGLDNWRKLKALHYNKQTTLYLESGEVERSVFQKHHYYFKPSQQISISWVDENNYQQKITFENEKASKYVNGQLDKNANQEVLKMNVLSSIFVVSIPFKILDKGVDLSYMGTDQLEDDTKVEVIQAKYDPSTYKNHSTPDIWWYYFDNQNFKLVGYMVKHAGHYSYVKNLSYIQNGPFAFVKDRESYRVTPQRSILYLRAKYTYENWEAKL